MRSVVVVLPASMWAMIPMFRVFSRGKLRGIWFLFLLAWSRDRTVTLNLFESAHKKGPCGPRAQSLRYPTFSYVAPFFIETVNAQRGLTWPPGATDDDSSAQATLRQGSRM